MAISRSGKRRILVEDRTYYWWVFDEYDQSYFDGVQVMIVSEDQDTVLRYGLHRPEEQRSAVISRGRGREQTEERVPCPCFEDSQGILTPSGVEKLIRWALES